MDDPRQSRDTARGTLRVDEVTVGGVPALRVTGELDHANAGRLHRSLDNLLASESARLFVDLTHVTYIDSAGIAMLYAAVERRDPAGWIGLIGAGPHTSRILELVGLTGALGCRLFPDRRSAQRAVERES